MNQALILILQEPTGEETEQALIINSGGLDLENPNHQREAIQMLRFAENTIMDWLLKPPCQEENDDRVVDEGLPRNRRS